MQNFSLSPIEIGLSCWRNRNLIIALIKRDVIGRYRGSFLGILWSFFNPLLMLAVYTFVFSVVFKSRWNVEGDSKTEFALILFAGLIVFNLFSESVTRAPGLILSNVNYVKRVVFPLEILPWVTMGSAVFHSLVSWSVWLLAYLVFYGMPHITILFLPLVMLPLVLLTIGVMWWLASLGVYLRDISQLVGVFVTILMFLSPIFYPVSALPEWFRSVVIINPLTTVVEQVRDVVFWGNYPNLANLAVSLTISAIVAWLGFFWFQKTRRGFADVI